MQDSKLATYLLLAMLAGILFIPFLGLVPLFDWDEVNFAECSREMLVSGNYARVQIDFQPFWEKPPLFFWLQALSMQVFGVNEFAARFPNALVGIATVLVLLYVGSKIYNPTFALLWILAYVGSFLPHFYFKSGIIDPLFNLFIFLSIYKLAFLSYHRSKGKRNVEAFFGGVFIGLAILTKGPVGLLIAVLCILIFWINTLKVSTFRFIEGFLYVLAAVLVSSLWYVPEMVNNGFWFIRKFIDYQYGLAFRSQDTAHEQPFWYHFVVLLVGCFPASIYFLRGVGINSYRQSPLQQHFRLWMLLLFWVTLLLFSMVKAKIVHYSSLCYFPITYIASDYIYQIYRRSQKFASWLTVFFIIVGLVISVVIGFFPFIPAYKAQILPLIDDKFAAAGLQAAVVWTQWEALAVVPFCLGVFIAVFFHRKHILFSAFSIYLGTLLTTQIVIYVYVPKVERHVQGAMIDFLKSVAKEDAYIATIDFRSYAHYFYGEVDMNSDARRSDIQWLTTGEIDKPAYFIARIDRPKPEITQHLIKLYAKDGFVFYKREKPQK
ncbi:MAG: glycosyltransferase family 39 protein [Microscillaceae bacterium]|nr:glycosyltransferase family 39 protein [Microscillaceae bacterium]MDW8460368.1 glycosyltransferase family 39 protein [Cytophagales bacterium]